MKKEISLTSFSLTEAEQNFILQNFLTKEKVDELKDGFLKKRDQESLGKDLISFQNALTLLQENGFFINDNKKFDLLNKLNGKSVFDFKDLIKAVCYLAVECDRDESEKINTEYIDAFVAVGGQKDGFGTVTVDMLETALEEFGLTIDMKSILESMGIVGHSLDYEIFCKLFENSILEDNQSIHSVFSVRSLDKQSKSAETKHKLF